MRHEGGRNGRRWRLFIGLVQQVEGRGYPIFDFYFLCEEGSNVNAYKVKHLRRGEYRRHKKANLENERIN
jgi:hypothetical protein